MSAYKSRTWPGPFGPSSARQFMSHPDVEPILRAVGARTGYHGFGAVDWVRHGDRLVILELNTRPVPAIHLAPLAGVDFPAAIRTLLAGAPAPPSPQPLPDGGSIVPMFPEDIYRGARGIAQWLPRPGHYSDVPWDDPALLVYHLKLLTRVARAT
jgi:hypothetical protein